MKKFLYILLALFVLSGCASIGFRDFRAFEETGAVRPDGKKTMYLATSLTGGASGALDAFDITGVGAPNAYDLVDGDTAMVPLSTGWYLYRFNATSVQAESSPDYIRPDDYATAGVWEKIDPIHSQLQSCTPGSGDCGVELPCNTLAVVSWPAPTLDGEVRCHNNSGAMEYYRYDGTQWVKEGTGSGLPATCSDDEILVADSADAIGWKCMAIESHPAYLTLLAAFNAAGLNAFTFVPELPAAYPYYSDSGAFNLDFTVTDSNESYIIAGVLYDIGSGYTGNAMTNTTGDVWRAALADLSAGTYTFQMEASDSKGTPNTGESSEYSIIVDLTDPVVTDNATDATHDGETNITLDVTVTEAYLASVAYSGNTESYTGAMTCTGTAPNHNCTASVDPNGYEDDITFVVTATDLSSNTGQSAPIVVAYAAGSACSSCDSTNDGYVEQTPNVGDGIAGSPYGRAWTFTTAATHCITGVEVGARDAGGTVTMTCEIRTDSGSEPGAIVGVGFTGSLTPLGDSGYPDNEILFAATQELAAGTYWVYCQPDAEVSWVKDDDGTGTFMYTSNGETWGALATKLVFSVLGCTP